ncbi:MAG TPA: hypothetical protein EYG68_10465 [Leucothrix mucor]|nr:hypothetical protein [Leucothrix mucor]
MMKIIQIIVTTIGLFIITSAVNTSFSKQSNEPHGASTSSLFSGPSGTGKTYIGETEKNLGKIVLKIKKK